MKKFFICLAILSIFGGFVFFLGWTSIRVKPEQTGIIISKTGGINKTPVINGKFSWNKEFLLPSNATLKLYNIKPVNITKTVTGSLASGEIYSSVLGSSNNFSYEFTYSISLYVNEDDLISLVSQNKVKTQDDLDSFIKIAGDTVCQLATNYILKKIEENPKFNVESIRRDELTKALKLYQECPEVQLSLFAVTNVKIPDYELFNSVRNQVLNNNIINQNNTNSESGQE